MIVPLTLKQNFPTEYFDKHADQLFIRLGKDGLFVGKFIRISNLTVILSNIKKKGENKAFKLDDPLILKEDEFRWVCDWCSFRSNNYYEIVNWALAGGTDSILIYEYLSKVAQALHMYNEDVYYMFYRYADLVIDGIA